jgi:uncharacterized protein YbjT (DUF2867 family)
MRVLVCGAHGFIGSAIVAALRDAGHTVVGAVRHASVDARGDAIATIACDFARDTDAGTWVPRLADIDAVVNAVGVLRENRDATFETVHHHTAAALARACATVGIARYVQVSALGDGDGVAFIASKHRGDAAILAALPGATILRPGLTYATRGSYGGTSLLRALSVLPVIPLPGDGRQLLQPLALADLARACVISLTNPAAFGATLDLVGPETVTLRDWLLRWRAWLAAGPPRTLDVPTPLVAIGSALADRFGRGPIGRTMTTLLSRGVVGSGDTLAIMRERLGVDPISPATAMREPSQAQDRHHARLYFIVPLLKLALAVVWIVSGALGLLLSAETIVATMRPPGWSPELALTLARAGGTVDALLGIVLLTAWRTRAILVLMLAQTLIYTLALGIAWTALWLDPWGGLLKNVVVIAALLAALATAEKR